MRLKNREDLVRTREILPIFEQDWWGAVVYSCFDSVLGTRAVSDRFNKPISGAHAKKFLGGANLPRGAVQHHRTQPGHTGAKIALISACEHSHELRDVLHAREGFHQRFEELLSLHLRSWGRTTCYDLLVRTGTLGIGGSRYQPDRAYLAGSTGPMKGFNKIWGIQVSKTNAQYCEEILRAWSRRWSETCYHLKVEWDGKPYTSGDFENALCIYQEQRRGGACAAV